tara:strand:+ start:2277 stop:2597 length:321 start_codon:yes stop_codon:yes gene_type:complete
MIDAGFVMLAMFVLAAIMVWAFFTFTPEYVDEKSVSAYNWSVIAILGLICAAFSFKAFAYLSAPRYSDFLPILLFLANMMILAVGLVVGFLVRNYFIFKSSRGFFR